ncbi:hypothetical protein [Methylopila sp. 73B]|uniref:hypothetical protein n=1 Tax=Methylopila sp. 73B TaxID=1120792 RepID=UPI0003681935|nr:hypothetical protein [Methylopila sp. 73B]
MSGVSLTRQITAMHGEITIRRRELLEEVRRGRAKEAQAAYAIESLEAVVETLKWLQQNETKIRAACAPTNGDALSKARAQ